MNIWLFLTICCCMSVHGWSVLWLRFGLLISSFYPRRSFVLKEEDDRRISPKSYDYVHDNRTQSRYTVHCFLNTVHRVLNCVHCAKLHSLRSQPHTLRSQPHRTLRSQPIVHCVLSHIHCILNCVHNVFSGMQVFM